MAKFRGVIGFVTTSETSPGVHTEVITEKIHTGEILQDYRKMESGSGLNDNLNLSNRFSVVGTPFSFTNMQYIRYIVYLGEKWKVKSVEVRRPRLIILVGEIYNG